MTRDIVPTIKNVFCTLFMGINYLLSLKIKNPEKLATAIEKQRACHQSIHHLKLSEKKLVRSSSADINQKTELKIPNTKDIFCFIFIMVNLMIFSSIISKF